MIKELTTVKQTIIQFIQHIKNHTDYQSEKKKRKKTIKSYQVFNPDPNHQLSNWITKTIRKFNQITSTAGADQRITISLRNDETGRAEYRNEANRRQEEELTYLRSLPVMMNSEMRGTREGEKKKGFWEGQACRAGNKKREEKIVGKKSELLIWMCCSCFGGVSLSNFFSLSRFVNRRESERVLQRRVCEWIITKIGRKGNERIFLFF